MHRWSKTLLRTTALCVGLLVPASTATAFTVTADVAQVPEGNSGTTDVTFTIECEGLEAGTLTATPVAGPAPAATAGSDFEETPVFGPAPVLACPSLVPQTATVKVIGDTLDELNENFKLDVTLGSETKSAQVTITDDDVPVATIAGLVFVVEGAEPAQMAVTLSQAPAQAVTLSYATEDSSALAGSDYTGASGQLTIPAGQTTGTVSVPIVDDSAPEPAEAFYVNLSTPVNATLSSTGTQAAVGIFDPDRPPTPVFSLPDRVTVREGDSGTVNVLFPVTLSRAAAERVRVNWRTANYTASLADYESANGTVTFDPGQTTKTISVNVKGDGRDEPNEAFGVVLGNPVGGTIGAGTSFGIITDDDGPKVSIGRPVPRGKSLILLVTCPKSADLCKGRLRATIGKLKAGGASFELRKGAGRELKVRLSRRARAALAKRARRVKFTATAADASGARRTVTRRYRVRRLR